MIKISDLTKYDKNMTIGDLINQILEEYPYICPKCKGRGQVYKEDENYDVGGYHFQGYIECDICQGYGRTKKEMKPKYKLIGYEEGE